MKNKFNPVLKTKADCMQNVNLMPTVIEAVKAYTTVGEIIHVMKDVYGEVCKNLFSFRDR